MILVELLCYDSLFVGFVVVAQVGAEWSEHCRALLLKPAGYSSLQEGVSLAIDTLLVNPRQWFLGSMRIYCVDNHYF